MIEKMRSDIYRILVELPQSPLRILNSYVILGKDRNLMIDTGFNQPECLKALREGIAELNLDMHKTDIFVTHFHADHSGLVATIKSPESQIYMSSTDSEYLEFSLQSAKEHWRIIEQLYADEGYPEEELIKVGLRNPARKFVAEKYFECNVVNHGDIIAIGDRKLECVSTSGHTPGHMCLYEKNEKIMFTGDHILFDITPNITTWRTMPEALEKYLDSLKKVMNYDVDMTLTGHRENQGDFKKRIKELLKHHAERLESVCHIIQDNPNLNGYEVASKMEWSIRAKNWEDFPPTQKWFAVGEALSHLNYLADRGKIRKKITDGIYTYEIADTFSESDFNEIVNM